MLSSLFILVQCLKVVIVVQKALTQREMFKGSFAINDKPEKERCMHAEVQHVANPS